MLNIIEDGLRSQAIVEELNREARVKHRVEKQEIMLAELNKKLGHTQIPNPVSEESESGYMKRIVGMRLRIGVMPLAKTIIQHQEEV